LPEKSQLLNEISVILTLTKLQRIKFGTINEVFNEIVVTETKNIKIKGGIYLGAKALEILIKRSINEGHGKVPEEWAEWIERIGCSPLVMQRSDDFSKWWSWANKKELQIAIAAVNAKNLEFFLSYLKTSIQGSEYAHQFTNRAKFLRKLLSEGKILDSRVMISPNDYQELNKKKEISSDSIGFLKHAPRNTSVICLYCIDDVYIVEGTQNFRFRAWINNFPVRGLFEREKNSFDDGTFRRTSNVPIMLTHDAAGNWMKKFKDHLRMNHRIRW
jgi:hypothetical protein